MVPEYSIRASPSHTANKLVSERSTKKREFPSQTNWRSMRTTTNEGKSRKHNARKKEKKIEAWASPVTWGDLVVDSELLPLLLVVVPVLRASAQARQEAHLSSPESTPTAGEGEHEAKKKIPNPVTFRRRLLLLLGRGLWVAGVSTEDSRSCRGMYQFFSWCAQKEMGEKRRRLRRIAACGLKKIWKHV